MSYKSYALRAPEFILTWGSRGDTPGEFYSPIGIFIDKHDIVYITDLNNARLQKFTTEGKYLGGFDLPRDTPDRKSSQAGGIVVDDHGLIYLTFMVQNRVGVYSDTGAPIREWGKYGNADGEFNQPGGIAFGPDGTLFVADQSNHRVQRFTRVGKFLGKWGVYGAAPGQFGGPERAGSRFAGPHFVSIDRLKRIYTTEGVFGRVQQLSLEGKPLAAWGNKGNEPGGFGARAIAPGQSSLGPIAVFADPRGRIWVSSLNDRVQAFTPEGKYLYGVAVSGSAPGQLARPHGMAMDSNGFFYICDAGNQRIQKFRVPR